MITRCSLTPAPWVGGRAELVEPGFEAGGIDFQGGVGELVSSPSNSAGAAEQMPEIGREDVVAGVDGVLHVTNEMSETNLVFPFCRATARRRRRR